MHLVQDIQAFIMYCVYGVPGSYVSTYSVNRLYDYFVFYLLYYFYHRLCEKFSSVCIVEVIVLAVVNLEINFDSQYRLLLSVAMMSVAMMSYNSFDAFV